MRVGGGGNEQGGENSSIGEENTITREVQRVELEKGKTSIEKGRCHTQPEDWKLRSPLLAKTIEHLRSRSLQVGLTGRRVLAEPGTQSRPAPMTELDSQFACEGNHR